MAADDAAAYQEALRQAFRSAIPLEPAIAKRRPAPKPEAMREAAADAPEAGTRESHPAFAAAAPEADAFEADAFEGRGQVTQPAFAVVPLVSAAPLVATAPEAAAPEAETFAPEAETFAPEAAAPEAETWVTRSAIAAAPLVATAPEAMTPSSKPLAYPQAGGPPPDVRSGVRVRTALYLVLVASVAGMIGGALVAGTVVAPRLAEPVGTPAAVPSGTVAPAATLPDGVAAGLLQVAAVNERLKRAATDLAAALKVKNPSAADVAPLLRKITADARSGEHGARSLEAWPAAGAFPANVLALYGAAATVAEDGLGAPLSDDAAYAAAGHRTLGALDALPAIAAATREIARRAGVFLPDEVPTPRV